MANKRIKNLTSKSTLASGDYFVVDNDDGTKKVNASVVLNKISTAQSTADSASTAASSASTNATTAKDWIRSTSSFPTGDAYSTTSAYQVGDLVIYDNTLYRCKTPCSAGSWNTNSSNFEQTTLAGAITDVNEALSNHTFKAAHIINRAITNSSYTPSEDGIYTVEMYGDNNGSAYISLDNTGNSILLSASGKLTVPIYLKKNQTIYANNHGATAVKTAYY